MPKKKTNKQSVKVDDLDTKKNPKGGGLTGAWPSKVSTASLKPSTDTTTTSTSSPSKLN